MNEFSTDQADFIKHALLIKDLGVCEIKPEEIKK